MAAIPAQHFRVGNQTVASHSLVTRFLKGAQWQTPPQLMRAPSWDLPLVLEAGSSSDYIQKAGGEAPRPICEPGL